VLGSPAAMAVRTASRLAALTPERPRLSRSATLGPLPGIGCGLASVVLARSMTACARAAKAANSAWVSTALSAAWSTTSLVSAKAPLLTVMPRPA
jgi:hypothetical protein